MVRNLLGSHPRFAVHAASPIRARSQAGFTWSSEAQKLTVATVGSVVSAASLWSIRLSYGPYGSVSSDRQKSFSTVPARTFHPVTAPKKLAWLDI